MGKSGNLYVIHAVGTEHYKIGITGRDIATRLKELQTGNHNKLEVVRSYSVDDMEKTEASIHRALEERRVSGEWYKLSTPYEVDNVFHANGEMATNDIDGYVVRQSGVDAGSDRFKFCLTLLSGSDLSATGKLIMFLWGLFVPLAPVIEFVPLTPEQNNRGWEKSLEFSSSNPENFPGWE